MPAPTTPAGWGAGARGGGGGRVSGGGGAGRGGEGNAAAKGLALLNGATAWFDSTQGVTSSAPASVPIDVSTWSRTGGGAPAGGEAGPPGGNAAPPRPPRRP